MEGKGVLFKRFAGIDVFDIEIDSKDPEEIIRTCQLLEPTFGGINLEDIKAPECFHIEKTLKETMDIPVFHDDQHGTAIIGAAGLINALEIVGKKIDEVRVVFSGAGASAISSARHFLRLGVLRQNMMMVDSKGVIYRGRTEGMEVGGAEVIGPILLGMSRPVHVLQRGSTVQDAVNLITIASVDAAEWARTRG